MEAEICIVHLKGTSEQLLTDEGKKNKQMEVMWDRIQALENQSKRNNVRLIGLNGTLLTCVQKILAEGLGVNVDTEFEIRLASKTGAYTRDKTVSEGQGDKCTKRKTWIRMGRMTTFCVP